MPYSSIVQSSMCRARETANVISGHLPNVPLHTCDLLQEGAPFPPEPPVGHWKPEMHVNYIFYLFKCLFSKSNWFTHN
jgi:serine/threonine-protein phosphatase PGAM5